MTTPTPTTPEEAQREVMMAATERLLMSHPSWFKRLSFVKNRGSEEARYAAQTLVGAVLRAAGPLMEAEVRQKLADEIEQLAASDTAGDVLAFTRRKTLFVAASVVRGEGNPDA